MASIIGSRLATRAAIRVNRFIEESFVCRRCLHQQTFSRTTSQSIRQSPFLTAFKQPGHYRMNHQTTVSTASILAPNAAFPRSATSIATTGILAGKTGSSFFPHTSSRSVGYWLLASAGSVFGIVIFGGLTRLTESGLSITEWRPVTGSLPPQNEQMWEEEFAKYKQSPEFVMLNSRMDLEDFKQIYWMEWGHRLWGRVVGITFLLPTIYFIARRQVSKPMAVKLVGICGLIGFQGFLGWWMVKSGLKDDLFAPGSHPRVSQYRLAAHLGTAFLAYSAMLWNGLRVLQAQDLLARFDSGAVNIREITQGASPHFRRAVVALSILVFTTVMSGALVAGLDAGLIYNDFPWMGQGLLPPKSEMLDPFYSHTPSQSDLIWRNMLENPVLVQLDHRILATTTFVSILGLWALGRLTLRRGHLDRGHPIQKSTRLLVYLATMQVTLGISTLWYLVPTPLAAAHQAGALALLSGVILLASRVWAPRRAIKLIRMQVKRIAQNNSQLSRRMS